MLERPPEYLTECVGEGGWGWVVNCSGGIRQGVSSLELWVVGLERWVAGPMQFTNLFATALTSVLYTPAGRPASACNDFIKY